MIFELVQGINLRTYLRLNGRLAERAVLKILIQILNGFGELLKQKIVHRDLKPENILIKDGILKVTGFHFSKKLSLHNPCVSIVGTPAYMAPQILQ
jgi:serine/threonine protein kinase